MTLRQLRYFRELIRQDMNVSAAAESLHVSQPSVSRQLHELADELGVELFLHSGKRLTGLTEAGRQIAEIVGEILYSIGKIHSVAANARKQTSGTLVIAATQYASNNSLAEILPRFCREQPEVEIVVQVDEPGAILSLVKSGEADAGIIPEPPQPHGYLAYFPIGEWRLTLVVPHDHELVDRQPLSMLDLAEFTISTYPPGSASRDMLEYTFRTHQLLPDMAYSLGSSVLILKQVESGIGVGIVAESAFTPEAHPGLRALDIDHLFAPMRTSVILRRKAHLRDYVYHFLALLLPDRDRAAIDREKDRPMAVSESPSARKETMV